MASAIPAEKLPPVCVLITLRSMSYAHCPACHRAYNLAQHAACPACPVAATVVDPAEDILAAADQLARALARATPAQRADAAKRMDGIGVGVALVAPAPRPGPEPARPIVRAPLAAAAELMWSLASHAKQRALKIAPAWVARARAAFAA